MTETPPLFAETPARPGRTGGGPDLLSEMLRAVRLTGSVFFRGSFTAPFAVVTPKRWDEGTPLAHLRHISIFHLIVKGGCTIELASGTRREIQAGDVLLMPFADRHKFWNGEPLAIAYAPDLLAPSPIEGMVMSHYGGGGEEMRVVCGFLESSEFLVTPVFRTLPELVVDRTDDDKVGALIASTVREIVTLVEAAKPGSQVMLGCRRNPPAGSPPSTIPSWGARLRSCMPIRPGAGPPRIWRASQAPRAPCWPSASMRFWASRRSNT
jgi:AraC family transcriptional regulator, alkane utilization regulator